MRFAKYHALGNDYIVVRPEDLPWALTPERIRRMCHRNYGVGSDGILLGPLESSEGAFGLRIFNPDGSEAEKSGNGLRIFSRFLWDQGTVGEEEFRIGTAGGDVTARVHPGGRQVTVALGPVSFDSARIPVAGPPRDVLNETTEVAGRAVRFCAATIGNPHCVVLDQAVNEQTARELGPHIETDPRFPNRTNVQFLEVLDAGSIRIEIWERGAGYTLASGSSSAAAAAVARRLGLCDPEITIHMPGGTLLVTIGDGFEVTQTGLVTRTFDGDLFEEMLDGG